MWQIITTALMAVAGSFASRALVGLGITLGTYAGLDYLTDNAVSIVQNNYDGIAPDILALLNMAGFAQAIGLVLGAYVTKAAMKSLAVFAGALT